MSYFENAEKIESEINHLISIISDLAGKSINREQILYSLFVLYEDELELDFLADVFNAFEEMNSIESRLIENLWVYEYDEFLFNPIEHGIEPFLQKKHQIKVNNSIWRLHKNDKDPFPSNPHLHCTESPRKLNPQTGEIFIRRKKIGTLTKKHLYKVQVDLKKANIAI